MTTSSEASGVARAALTGVLTTGAVVPVVYIGSATIVVSSGSGFSVAAAKPVASSGLGVAVVAAVPVLGSGSGVSVSAVAPVFVVSPPFDHMEEYMTECVK